MLEINSFDSHFKLTDEPHFNRTRMEINKKLLRLGGVLAKYDKLIMTFGKPIVQDDLISWSFIGKGDEIIFIYNLPNDNFNKEIDYFWVLNGNESAQKEIYLILKWINFKINIQSKNP